MADEVICGWSQDQEIQSKGTFQMIPISLPDSALEFHDTFVCVELSTLIDI